MLNRFHRLQSWLTVSKVCAPWFGRSFCLLFPVGLIWGLWVSPVDYQQGESVRIMYVHVPASWLALGIYTMMAVCSALGFIYKTITGHLLTRAFSLVGLAFAFISLMTGALWGIPTWGTWWVWDARLTSMLLLFVLYLGHFLLITAFDHEERGLQAAGVLAIFGWINVPIIKFSVDWWYTLHQPASIFRAKGTAIHGDMLKPLMVMAIAFSLFTAWAVLTRLKGLIRQRQRYIALLKTDKDTSWEKAA